MYGRLALHAESVTLPLLAPDAPVVTWWHGAPPERIAYDPLGVLRRAAHHRRRCRSPTRSRRCASGPTTSPPATPTWPGPGITRWRAALASAFDGAHDTAVSATVDGGENEPSALLLGRVAARPGWALTSPSIDGTDDEPIRGVEIELRTTAQTTAPARGQQLVLQPRGQQDSFMPFGDRAAGRAAGRGAAPAGRRPVYAEALARSPASPASEERPPTASTSGTTRRRPRRERSVHGAA